MTRFLLIRHATTDANGVRLAGRAAGVSLNRKGWREADKLSRRLAGWPIDAVYASPLERAVETAEPIARLLGLTVEYREDLLEIDFGEWTGRAFEDLAGEPRFRSFNDFRSGAPAPGGEFMVQAQARVAIALGVLRSRHPRQCVAVVSHGDVIKAAIANHAGIPLDNINRLEISPASVSVVEIDDDRARILCINDIDGSWPEA